MKISILTLLIAFIFIPASAQTTQPLSSALQEANKLSVETVKLFREKKFSDALPLAQKVVAIREKELGKKHVLVAQGYRNLAYIQFQLAKRKDADDSFENALDIYEKSQPLAAADENHFAELLEIVAVNQAVDGEFYKAEKKLLRAVALREKLSGSDSIETSNALAKLGELYQANSDYAKSAPLLLRALEIKTKKLGAESDQTEEILQSVSCVLTKLGREQEATDIQNKLRPPNPVTDIPSVKLAVVNGKAIRLITPPYPAEAKAIRAQGKVEVKIAIDENGKVVRACAVSGAKELQRVSELAAYKSTFTQTKLGGKTVKVTGTIVYMFVAQ